jgi:hypothetical protein
MFEAPLPDSVIATLRTADETAALAASMIIAGAFPGVLAFAARVASPAREVPEAPKPASEPRGRYVGKGRVVDRDEQVLANLKACPDASIAQRARVLGCTRSTVDAALERLAIADRVRRTGRGAWIATKPAPAIPAETARWIGKPLTAQRKRHAEEEEAEEAAHA